MDLNAQLAVRKIPLTKDRMGEVDRLGGYDVDEGLYGGFFL